MADRRWNPGVAIGNFGWRSIVTVDVQRASRLVMLSNDELINRYVGGSVSGLTGFFTGLMKGVGAGGRVFWLLDRQSAIPLDVGKSIPRERNGAIRFENVHFTYPSRKEVEVLKGVSLTVEPGTSVALV